MAIDIPFKASVDTGDGAKSLRSLKQEFKDTQKELDGLTVGSENYISTLKKLGKVKDEIGDLNDEINAFKPEGKVQAFGNVVSGLASGFQAATGAAALFGGENKEIEKTLLKVQAVMAFTEGIKGLVSLGDGFKVLSNVIKSNPIFLIAAIIIAIGSAMYALKDKIAIIGEAFDAMGKALNYVVQKGKDFLDFLGLTSFAATKTTDSIIANNERIKNANNSRYDSEIAAAKRAGKETELIEIAKLNSITKTNDEVIRLLLLRKQANGELSDDEIKKLSELREENKKTYQQILDLSDQYRDKEIEAQKKLNEKAQALLEKRRQDHQKYLDAVADAENAEADKYDALLKKQKEDARHLEAQSYNDARADAQKMLDDYDKDLLAQAELKVVADRNSFNANLELLNLKRDQELENTELTENEKLAIKQKYAQQEKQLTQQQFEGTLTLAKVSNDGMMALSDLYFAVKSANTKKGSAEDLANAKKQFKINKDLSLVSATIMGIQSVIAAYQSGAAVPVAGVVLGPAMAILAGIAAAANIAKISATQFGGGGGGIGALPSAPSGGGVPTINAPRNFITDLNPDGTIKNQSQQNKQPTIKAVVVETDITGSQKRVSSIQESAKVA